MLGTGYFLQLLSVKALQAAFRYEVLHLFRKDLRPQRPTAAPPGVSFGHATEDELAVILDLNPAEPRDYIRQRLDDGESCYVARLAGGELCAYLWCAPGERLFRHRSRRISIGRGEVYVRDVQTLPAYRGRGITPRFLAYLDGRLHSQNVETMRAAIRGLNHSSRKSFTKAGFCLEEKIYFLCVPLMKQELTFTRRARAS